MQEVFVPDLQSAYRWLSFAILATVFGVSLAVYGFKRKDFRLRQLAQLFGPMLALIGIASTVMVAWDMLKSPSVAVMEEFVLVGNDTLRHEQIERAYLEPVNVNSLGGKTQIKEIGILELSSGRQILFDQDRYDVRALIEALRRFKS